MGTQTHQLVSEERTARPKSKLAHVQMFMSRALYTRLKARATSEDLPVSVWIRRTCALALRRKAV
jgi:hypothetical protein